MFGKVRGGKSRSAGILVAEDRFVTTAKRKGVNNSDVRAGTEFHAVTSGRAIPKILAYGR